MRIDSIPTFHEFTYSSLPSDADLDSEAHNYLYGAIIDDDSNVSAMVSTTSDTCIIAGNLQLIDEGTISLVKLTDDNNHVHVGDKVVTSNISEKFLPGILIGYISELNNDSNNLTKSGTVNPAVDFKHLQEVLVIRTRKTYVASDGKKWQTSLQNTCMACHANKAEFCDKCHNANSVSPYCWDCHVEPQGNNK